MMAMIRITTNAEERVAHGRGESVAGMWVSFGDGRCTTQILSAGLVQQRKQENVCMKRYGQVVRLKPERRNEYLRHHRAVWPGVLRTIAECNIRNYSIYEHGELLFAYFEYHGNDFAADMAKMGVCPETQRWWGLMFPMLEKLPPEIEGQRWTDLAEVFHFDGESQV
jgi:L-rhamnose mutarotase